MLNNKQMEIINRPNFLQELVEVKGGEHEQIALFLSTRTANLTLAALILRAAPLKTAAHGLAGLLLTAIEMGSKMRDTELLEEMEVEK